MSVSHSAASAQLDASLHLLGGDLAAAAAAAPENLDAWVHVLRATADNTFDTLCADLTAFKGVLSGGDPAQISSALQTLAEHITSMVDNANPRYINSLNQLAGLLRDAAHALKTGQV